MTTPITAPYLNPSARAWRAEPLRDSPIGFHRSLPGYTPTPLTPLPELARALGVGRVCVKDESQRLGLPAFKVLGASYAIVRVLSARLGAGQALSLDRLRDRLRARPGGLRLVAATDGNHGRAVARIAASLGLAATIYVPDGVSQAAKDAIAAEGAALVELALPYDDVVAHAAAQADTDSLVIQDTSWPGYADVPQWIVDGYTTMLAEVDQQLLDAGGQHPDLVVVPAGVGSLAQAVVAHYRSATHAPVVLVVEPVTAPAVITSLHAGAITPLPTGETVMTGLNCGTVSTLAWPVLQAGVDAAVTVTDPEALDAASELAGLGVDAGPCGAATLAGARTLLADQEARERLGVTADAVVVLLSTEGRAANPKGSL